MNRLTEGGIRNAYVHVVGNFVNVNNTIDYLLRIPAKEYIENKVLNDSWNSDTGLLAILVSHWRSGPWEKSMYGGLCRVT
jgi:pectate lyase